MIDIFKFDLSLMYRFLIANANSTAPAPPPIKAMSFKSLILFKKLFANPEIGLTGIQNFSAPFIFL